MLTKELTNSLLKEKMTDAIVRRYGSDFNTCMTPGHYSVNAENWVNHPKGAYKYGDLLVFGEPGSFLTQEYITHNSVSRFWRIYHKAYGQTTGNWDDWKRIAGEKVT